MFNSLAHVFLVLLFTQRGRNDHVCMCTERERERAHTCVANNIEMEMSHKPKLCVKEFPAYAESSRKMCVLIVTHEQKTHSPNIKRNEEEEETNEKCVCPIDRELGNQ